MADSWEEQADAVGSGALQPPPPPPPKPSGFSFNPNASSFSFNPSAAGFTPGGSGGFVPSSAPPSQSAVPPPPPPPQPQPVPKQAEAAVAAPPPPPPPPTPAAEAAPSEDDMRVDTPAAAPAEASPNAEASAADGVANKMASTTLDEPEEKFDLDEEAILKAYEELLAKDPRDHLNVVFIGHIDAGKSTLAGQILFLTGGVDKRTIEKYEKEAKEKNREGWYMAYIMDTNEEERTKGITVEVKLVVVDSITFHFRQEFRDMAHRARVLTQMAQDFMNIAEQWGLAVVFINQVTTKLGGQDAKLVPALGESWGHAASTSVTLYWQDAATYLTSLPVPPFGNRRAGESWGHAASTRVILYWQDNERYAHVYKSPCLPPSTAHFLITADGVRGVRPRGDGGGGEKRAAPDGGFS